MQQNKNTVYNPFGSENCFFSIVEKYNFEDAQQFKFSIKNKYIQSAMQTRSYSSGAYRHDVEYVAIFSKKNAHNSLSGGFNGHHEAQRSRLNAKKLAKQKQICEKLKDAELGECYAFEPTEGSSRMPLKINIKNHEQYRIHDARLGRFLSVDPMSPKYPWYSPYQFAGNKAIMAIDLEGLEDCNANGSSCSTEPNENAQSSLNSGNTNTEQIENNKKIMTEAEDFLNLIILPSEPIRPEKTIEEWKTENKKPVQAEFKTKNEYKEELEKYNNNVKKHEQKWENYNNDMNNLIDLRNALNTIATSDNNNFAAIRRNVINGNVKINITIGQTDGSEAWGRYIAHYNNCTNNNCGSKGEGTLIIDINTINNPNGGGSDATVLYDNKQPQGTAKKQVTLIGTPIHELGHHCYSLSHLENINTANWIDENEKNSTTLELQAYEDGF